MHLLYRVIIGFSLIVALMIPGLAQAQPIDQVEATGSSPLSVNHQDPFLRGTDKILSGDYRGAITDLNQAIQSNPDDAQSHMNHGLARAGLGDKQGAVLDFNQALQISPKLAEAYYNRGFVRAELQDYAGAVGDFNQALRLHPEDADTCHCRGMVRYQLGDQQGAIADLRLAAQLYLKQGKVNALQELLNQIKGLYPQTELSTF